MKIPLFIHVVSRSVFVGEALFGGTGELAFGEEGLAGEVGFEDIVNFV